MVYDSSWRFPRKENRESKNDTVSDTSSGHEKSEIAGKKGSSEGVVIGTAARDIEA